MSHPRQDRRPSTIRAATVAAAVIAIALLHRVTPAGPHEWHWVHLAAQKLFYLPIILAAAWFGTRAAVVAAATITLLFLGHTLVDWAGDPMSQAAQTADLVNFWLVAAVSSLLFERQRKSRRALADAHEETLTALASSLELREQYTALHSRRVRDYTLRLADRLGIDHPAERRTLALGALLHDIGKIGIPDRVLLKPSALSEEERREIRRHPETGGALIGKVPSLAGARNLVEAHHENFDGSGYPRGLAGESIPLGARLFAVADTFDAITTSRSYRTAGGYRRAADEITRGRGTQFDPRVVDAFLSVPFEEWASIAAASEVTLRRE